MAFLAVALRQGPGRGKVAPVPAAVLLALRTRSLTIRWLHGPAGESPRPPRPRRMMFDGHHWWRRVLPLRLVRPVARHDRIQTQSSSMQATQQGLRHRKQHSSHDISRSLHRSSRRPRHSSMRTALQSQNSQNPGRPMPHIHQCPLS